MGAQETGVSEAPQFDRDGVSTASTEGADDFGARATSTEWREATKQVELASGKGGAGAFICHGEVSEEKRNEEGVRRHPLSCASTDLLC